MLRSTGFGKIDPPRAPGTSWTWWSFLQLQTVENVSVSRTAVLGCRVLFDPGLLQVMLGQLVNQQ